MCGDEVDRFNDVVEHSIRDEVVEVDPDPSRLDSFAAEDHLVDDALGVLIVDAEQCMAIWPGA